MSTVKLNQLAIRRLSKVVLPKDSASPAGLSLAAGLAGNLTRLGYALNSEAYRQAQLASADDLTAVLRAAQALKGDAKYKPMYPNFPKQVADASWEELYSNAILHYLGDCIGVRIIPSYTTEARKKLKDTVEIAALGITSEDDFRELAAKLVAQGQPYSSQDQEDILLLGGYIVAAPVAIKENLAFLFANFPELDWSDSVRTVTDVLRIATMLSGGDQSLAANSHFRLTRIQRRRVLSLLESVLERNGENYEDFARHEEKWKRLSKALHPGDYGYQKSLAALSALYRGQVVSFDSQVEAAMASGNLKNVLTLLKGRPGVLARRLAEILRKYPEGETSIVRAFSSVSNQVSIPVLVQMWNLFNGPLADELDERSILTKGSPLGMLIPNRLERPQTNVLRAIERGLKGRHSEVKVYAEGGSLEGYTIPLAIRNASPGLRTVGRGSRIKVGEAKRVIRLFMHWRNISGGGWDSRVDLDLSAVFASEDFSNFQTVAYYNLRDQAIKAYHSGDITSAPKGAAEFIDIDIESALKAGYRYVLPTVYNYSRQKFSDVPEAWAGAMLREKAKSGEIFEPSTVVAKYDLTSGTVNSTPFIFDLLTREMIWCDLAVGANSYFNYSVASNANALVATLKSAVSGRQLTLDRFVKLVATTVDTPQEADLILRPDSTADVLSLL